MKQTLILLLVIMMIGCQQETIDPEISQQTIAKHMAALASDEFQGRMPCTTGEEKTVEYIVEEMKAMGLQPGNGDNYIQTVPLLEIETTMLSDMEINTSKGKLLLKPKEDYVVHTERGAGQFSLDNSSLVFCGFGIVSEQDEWNDYEGLDMSGKTAVVLVNDPGFGGEDSTFFKGNTMTVGGRWDTKYDYIDELGADGLLIIHQTSMAGYPWFVIQSSWTGAKQGLDRMNRYNDTAIKGWITIDAAQKLFEQSGFDLTEMIQAARTPGFRPIDLKATASVEIEATSNSCESKNVIGIFPGSKNNDEYVLYTAHWDHIGIGTPINGDSIYNGALDNASGTSTVLSIAETFAKATAKPERSVAFLFVTAEEQGLLGSEYYAEYPTIPNEQVVANLNMDGVNPAGSMKDFTITGMGKSTMDDIAEEEAEKQGRYTIGEQEPEKGYFYRSDQFSFAKKGIPVLYGGGTFEHMEKGKTYAKEYRESYIAERYHAPSDNYDAETWNFDGMVQDGQLFFNVGWSLANSEEWPEWKEGSEFGRTRMRN